MTTHTSTISASLSTDTAVEAAKAEQWLQSLFLLSGMAALTYQICWQRILFFSFGTDIESVTIVVSTFMLGLGLGALGGGWAADRCPARIILLFALAELSIGVFGLASPYLIPAVSDQFMSCDRATIALANLLLLLVPTCLMGATLPMLVAHFFRLYGSVGVSVGQLYFVNTLGGAVACMAVGFFGFRFLTLKEVIAAAACINLAVALIVLFRLREARARVAS
jgi:predicted membrane-bound spermidine synthase